jgi:hypothetical protein
MHNEYAHVLMFLREECTVDVVELLVQLRVVGRQVQSSSASQRLCDECICLLVEERAIILSINFQVLMLTHLRKIIVSGGEKRIRA